MQNTALDKLEARASLKDEGKIVLKIKLSKNLNTPVKLTTVELPSDSTGLDLANVVAERIDSQANSLKLITGGKVIKEGQVLLEQGVKPGVAVMVTKINKESTEMKKLDEQRNFLDSARADAEVLGKSENGMGLEILSKLLFYISIVGGMNGPPFLLCDTQHLVML